MSLDLTFLPSAVGRVRRTGEVVPGATLALICSLLLGACAVDGWGSFERTTYANDTARGVRIEGCGLHLSSRSVDRGISLGCIDRFYFCGRGGPPAAIDPSRFLEPAAIPPAEGVAGEICRSNSLVYIDRTTGAQASLGRLGSGVLIGRRNRVVQLTSGDCTAVTRVRIHVGDDGDARMTFLGEREC